MKILPNSLTKNFISSFKTISEEKKRYNATYKDSFKSDLRNLKRIYNISSKLAKLIYSEFLKYKDILINKESLPEKNFDHELTADPQWRLLKSREFHLFGKKDKWIVIYRQSGNKIIFDHIGDHDILHQDISIDRFTS